MDCGRFSGMFRPKVGGLMETRNVVRFGLKLVSDVYLIAKDTFHFT